MFKISVTSRPNTADEERVRQCNLQATQLIDKGDFSSAINMLEESARLMPTVSTEYPISQYVRLGITLQKSGRFNEAKTEFDRLLKEQSCPYRIASILDKLRLIHMREGLYADAIVYAVDSLAMEVIAFKQQGRDIRHLCTTPELWVKKIKNPLKKLEQPDLVNEIAAECVAYANKASSKSCELLVSNVAKKLGV